MRHWKRAAKSKPLVEPPRPAGWGVLETDGERVRCAECGRWLRALGHHVREHGLTPREYKLRWGLPLQKGLSAPDLARANHERGKAQVGTSQWTRFEKARDPVAAALCRDEDSMNATGRGSAHAVQAAANGRAGRTGRIHTCQVCGATWCVLPGGNYRARTCSAACAKQAIAQTLASKPRANAARDSRIIAESRKGKSVRELAAEFGLTGARIRQILHQ
jgi:hypothetical protein